MKFSALSARERRTVTIGAVLLLPMLFLALVVKPYRVAVNDARERLDAERDALARERGAVAMAQRNPELQHLTDSVLRAIEPRLFEGRDDVMTSSELAAYLGDLATQNHVWMQDATTRAATTTTPGVRTLHVEVRAESDFRGFLSFLKALDHGEKFVRIERLDISRVLSGPGNENAETLSMSATIAGYAMTPGDSGARAPARAGAGGN